MTEGTLQGGGVSVIQRATVPYKIRVVVKIMI